jgi:hypothetical protein
VFYGDREGEHPDTVAYFPAMDYGADANRTLELQARKRRENTHYVFPKKTTLSSCSQKYAFLSLRTAEVQQKILS